MRPFSAVLLDLIDFTAEVITRPARFYGSDENQRLAALAIEVRHADALPAEGIRTTRAGIAIVNVLEEFFSGDRKPTSHLLGNAGNMLLWLREAADTALSSERGVKTSEQADTYARPSLPSQSVELS